ncbi:alpha/beta hydrolase [Loktanella sp. D2R18]|uniref:alpha/beta hydrolase n=1 Tax=Rhodobacterales TaxID=204455 RepID=UPI000DE9A637|nr:MULTISPECIES: alpha/beta hydrolase [Rhodobacterales]MDO6590262.1 alpha/beta hydrolase [Yoonia sp. 1_MG-2023]RBW42928.1 alpha/beta hydrolase [Loktanella sp. D2R18]
METAPLFDDIAHGPAGGAAHWLKTSDGLRIRVGHWNKSNAQGTVLIFPGRTEFIEKYGATAKALHDRGFASVVVDWRGQGISDRMTPNRAIGHVGSFRDFQYDVAAVVAYAKAQNMPKPYFLIGHSMGGCIGLRALNEGLDIKAAMFSAPMWGIQMSVALRPIAWGLSAVSRQLGFDETLAPGQFEQPYVLRAAFEGNALTNDRAMFETLGDQLRSHPDLALGGPSLRWLNTSLREMHRLNQLQSPQNIPCLTFLGSNEAIVDPTRIRERMGRWPNGELRLIAGGQHEMLMDRAVQTEMIDAAAAHFEAAIRAKVIA